MGGAAGAARSTVTSPRFHVPAAGPGGRVSLPEHAAHHAREVLRLRAGAAVRIFDGAGAEFEAELDSVTRGGVWAWAMPLTASSAMLKIIANRVDVRSAFMRFLPAVNNTPRGIGAALFDHLVGKHRRRAVS